MWAAAYWWFYTWQTLFAGVLALLAGGLTVWGTLIAAKRQVKAANDAANRQIIAAQEQTVAAQHQTAVMRDMERKRIAREGFAFYAMLEAAMGAVVEDVEAARQLPPVPAEHPHWESTTSVQAYDVRQQIKRTGFPELRPAFLRFGGTSLTEKFLRLDKEIEDFSAQYLTPPAHSPFHTPFLGINAGLEEQLDRIEQQAQELRSEAEQGKKITGSVVADDLA
jgi:hypothetical protein